MLEVGPVVGLVKALLGHEDTYKSASTFSSAATFRLGMMKQCLSEIPCLFVLACLSLVGELNLEIFRGATELSHQSGLA